MKTQQITDQEKQMRQRVHGAFWHKFQEVKHIIIKRKSAFGCYEWMKLVEVLKIDEK